MDICEKIHDKTTDLFNSLLRYLYPHLLSSSFLHRQEREREDKVISLHRRHDLAGHMLGENSVSEMED